MRFLERVFAIPNGVEDLQILRLIRAFEIIADPNIRRSIVLQAEAALEQQQAQQKAPRTEHQPNSKPWLDCSSRTQVPLSCISIQPWSIAYLMPALNSAQVAFQPLLDRNGALIFSM
ncbi:MAG TPA: hypothetical protein VIM62_11135 [Acidobacteriaceae bacterium]